MKTLLVLLALLSLQSVFAKPDYYCTKWTRQSGVSCVFGGRNADVWARQCENPCSFNNRDPQCDIDRLCLDLNPNDIQGACSAWVRESSMTCNNPNTGRWEQKWIRACQKGLVTVWCSDDDPNQH